MGGNLPGDDSPGGIWLDFSAFLKDRNNKTISQATLIITVIIMKKQCLKSWVGIFWVEIQFSRGEFDWKKLFREGGGGVFLIPFRI